MSDNKGRVRGAVAVAGRRLALRMPGHLSVPVNRRYQAAQVDPHVWSENRLVRPVQQMSP